MSFIKWFFLAALLLTALLVACSTPTDPDSAPPVPPPPIPQDETADACVALDELQCITSDACTLVLVGEQLGYRCRTSEGPCELGFRQHSDSAESCEAEPGCIFVPGHCYCSPDVTCICGGGPPPQCVAG